MLHSRETRSTQGKKVNLANLAAASTGRKHGRRLRSIRNELKPICHPLYCMCMCVCVSVCVQAQQKKKRGKWKEGVSKGFSGGIKPKPQDISDLEGKWVKQGGGKKREEGKMRISEGSGQRDGEREVFRGQLESLQNPLLKPTIKFQPKPRSQDRE